MRVRVRLVPAAVGLSVTALLAGCGPTAAIRPRPTASPTPPSVTQLVETAAHTFMTQLVAQDYPAQWNELAPTAQATWPSEAARSAFLSAKFQGAAAVTGFQMGAPTPASTWVDREDPQVQVPGARAVPVQLQFSSPTQVLPAGVAADYSKLVLMLVPQASGPPLVVGEGPASIDAPVIVPPSPPTETASVPILMYHVVAPFPNPAQWNSTYAYDLEYGLTVTPAQFAAQMAYLSSAGAHAISLTRLADFLMYGLPLPPKPVAITFDDGRESPLQNAVPVLRTYGYTATFFVPSGLVGRYVTTRAGTNPQHYLTWAQIDQMATTGFWIEDHTLFDNTPLWGLPSSEVQQLAGQTGAAIAAQTGVPVQFIAYSGPWPFSTATQSGPAETTLFQELGQLGYVGGAVDARVDSAAQATGEIWQMPRVRMNPNEAGSALGPWVP